MPRKQPQLNRPAYEHPLALDDIQKMIKEDLFDFLINGELKNFPFGSPKSLILEKLGNSPDDYGDDESSYFTFDNTEFYFFHRNLDTPRLMGIVILPWPMGVDGNWDVNYRWLNEELNYAKSQELLKEENIDFQEAIINKDDHVLVTKGEVVFYFFEEDGKLNKIGRFIDIAQLEKYVV